MWLYLCLQLLPARCERGAKVQDPPRRLRSPRVFLRSGQLPQRLHLGLVLLHRRRAAPVQPHGGAAVHGGRQQELRRFLESSAVAGQELQHLLPGHEQSQRGECCRYMKLNSETNGGIQYSLQTWTSFIEHFLNPDCFKQCNNFITSWSYSTVWSK